MGDETRVLAGFVSILGRTPYGELLFGCRSKNISRREGDGDDVLAFLDEKCAGACIFMDLLDVE